MKRETFSDSYFRPTLKRDKKDPRLENCVVRRKYLEFVIEDIGWIPVIDCCADSLGANSICPIYFDNDVNTLKKLTYLIRKRFVMNPSFSKLKRFIRLAE